MARKITNKLDVTATTSGRNFPAIIKELLSYPTEEEWFESKENWYQPDVIGEYISALSNAAALKGRPFGYLLWGVENSSHALTGTTVDYRREVHGEP